MNIFHSTNLPHIHNTFSGGLETLLIDIIAIRLLWYLPSSLHFNQQRLCQTPVALCPHCRLLRSRSDNPAVLLQLGGQSSHHHHRDSPHQWAGLPQRDRLSPPEHLHQPHPWPDDGQEHDNGQGQKKGTIWVCPWNFFWTQSWSKISGIYQLQTQ